MKIFAINGSGKGRNGLTYRLFNILLDGMRQNGAEVETVDLKYADIHTCKACMKCWLSENKKCFQQDEMQSYLEQMINSDLLVFESPVYLQTVTSLMKKFIERCMPFSNKGFRISNNIYYHCLNKKVPPIVVLDTCGLPNYSNFEAIDVFWEKLALGWDTKIVGKIYLSESYLYAGNNDALKFLLNDYERRLWECGKEIIENGCLSIASQERINEKLLNPDIYVENAKSTFFGIEKSTDKDWSVI